MGDERIRVAKGWGRQVVVVEVVVVDAAVDVERVKKLERTNIFADMSLRDLTHEDRIALNFFTASHSPQ